MGELCDISPSMPYQGCYVIMHAAFSFLAIGVFEVDSQSNQIEIVAGSRRQKRLDYPKGKSASWMLLKTIPSYHLNKHGTTTQQSSRHAIGL